VYLADHDAEVRRVLRLMLEQALGMTVAGEAAHTWGLPALVEAAQADILLIDWDLPGRVDAWLLSDLRRLPRRPVVVITSSQADVKDAALAAGADGFADKSEPPESLLAIVRDYLARWTHH
jgi:DNA-binding NarL/FixJ family response regulator